MEKGESTQRRNKRLLVLQPTDWIDVKEKKKASREEKQNAETEDENEPIFDVESPPSKARGSSREPAPETRSYSDGEEEDEQNEEGDSSSDEQDGNQVYPCRWEECDETFPSKEKAIEHQDSVHLKDVNFQCYHCKKKGFKRAYLVRTHARQCSENPSNKGKPRRLILAQEEIRKKRTRKTKSYFVSLHNK